MRNYWSVCKVHWVDRVSLSIKNGWLDEDGKTYIHYSVADIMVDTGFDKNKILKCLKEFTTQTSRSHECKPLEVYDVNSNNTENNTNINYINTILSIYIEDAIDGMECLRKIRPRFITLRNNCWLRCLMRGRQCRIIIGLR
jgi:hypothetical protein